jgi:segregation and condensation protein B
MARMTSPADENQEFSLSEKVSAMDGNIAPQAGVGEEGTPEESSQEEESLWTPEPDKLLCALLFASHEYLTARNLRDIMGEQWDIAKLRQLVKTVNRNFEERDMPFEVAEVDGSFRTRTVTKYYPWLRKLFKDTSPRRLSQASLETLAIIAYKQPITKAEIEAIRGVNVDGCMKNLLDKKLIDIDGKTEALGSAYTYATTRDFMRYFGIHRVPEDLPKLSEFEDIVNARSLVPQVAMDGTVMEITQPEESEPEAMPMAADNGTITAELETLDG